MARLLVVFLSVFELAFGETIHFTNSVKHLKTTKNFTTYEVDVPGSGPITIIEANPEDLNARKPAMGQFRNAVGAGVEEHAKVVRDDQAEGLKTMPTKKTLYSPDLLNKFLRDYTERLKNADPSTKQKLMEIGMMTNQQALQLDGEQSKEDQFNLEDTDERNALGNNKWYGDNRKAHPWNSKDGWVTMEAVPWSESKVSKWHSSSNKNNGIRQHNSYQSNGQWAGDDSEEMLYRPKPSYSSITSPPSNNFYSSADDDYVDSLYASNRPAEEKPSKPVFDSFYNRRYKPSEDYVRKTSQYNPDYSGDSWYDHGFKKPTDSNKILHSQSGDIITDGRKPQFPPLSSPQLYQQQQQSNKDRYHPQSYPDSGNGEWVLISTTKGYQYPRRHGQRAISFQPAALSHKSVKLTVLPMKNSLDMTTSHNGLIEVASSTQTVEQSFKEQQNKNSQQSTALQTTTVAPVKRKRRLTPQISLIHRDSAAQDTSAVLAAVSAGMVPATLAVLAPMVLGRRRRRRRSSDASEPNLTIAGL
ncbi:uncharacterized protein LOC128744015 [Sabethes cyaneus]|uniref:uncharacterized protein LOC128744015 n=1 Tax=Sabethes cyaneus TaxID=53552 RepID=UPI00237E3ED3|nr:uncharacterized protein LOC128744015 [Sabethes cyaneus]